MTTIEELETRGLVLSSFLWSATRDRQTKEVYTVSYHGGWCGVNGHGNNPVDRDVETVFPEPKNIRLVRHHSGKYFPAREDMNSVEEFVLRASM